MADERSTLLSTLDAVLDESLTNPLGRLPPTAIRLGNPIVAPGRSIRIGLEQHPSATNLLARPLQLLNHLLKNLAFALRQSNNLLLPHAS